MRKLSLWFVLVLFVGFAGSLFAQEPTIKFDLRDFYFYDENNIMKRLDLAPKIMVRFLKNLSRTEQSQFLEKFSPVTQKMDTKDSSAVIIGFSPTIAPYQIVEKLNELASSGTIEVASVVYIDNIEAVAEGIIVEPKTLLSVEAVEKRMKRFGDFEIRQSKPGQQGAAWVIYLSGIKPPLHMLLLANLVNKDSWVKRAYPHFRYLHDPIVGALEIEPVSGTVDEARVIKFSIKVFDPAIKVREDLLPNFNEGKFAPMSGDSASPSPFFFLDGDKQRSEFSGLRSRTLVFSWKFRNYAVGEWTVSGQPVQYEKNGELFTLISPKATIVVTSLIGNLAIDDMPLPKSLILPVREVKFGSTPSLLQLPSYWFERWVGAEIVAHYSFLATLLFFGVTIILFLITTVPYTISLGRKKLERERFLNGLKKSCSEAAADVSLESYRKLRDVVKKIEKELGGDVSSIYQSLNVMYTPDFSPESQEVKDICDKILVLLEKGGQK